MPPPYERGEYDTRRPRGRRAGGGTERGVPDGLLVGVLGFLLGLTALTWSATGLAAWLDHGAWPDGLTFPRTAPAMRELVSQPQDIAAAWPGTPPEQLSGYGLFWGVFIGQLMVLTVLTVFTLGTVTRWRAVRAARREEGLADAGLVSGPERPPESGPERPPESGPERPPESGPERPPERVPEPSDEPRAAAEPTARAEAAREPVAPAAPGVLVGARPGAAADAVRDAPGAVVVVTGDPAVWSGTAGARAKLGPVHVYDPAQLTEAPARLRWAPHQGCEDMESARTRAAALLAPVRSPARGDEAVHAAAQTLLRCWLHAAAAAGETFRQVHRWALNGSSKDAVRILRTNPAASSGAAGELEATLTAYPERREAATALVRRALDCLSQLHIRNACTPGRGDRVAWESFVAEWGSLYVVGEHVEDPYRVRRSAMPLLTALVSAVAGQGHRMAARSSSGRIDPPVTLVLDQPATLAPLPELPSLLADGEQAGLLTHVLLRSEEQIRTWWPELAARRR